MAVSQMVVAQDSSTEWGDKGVPQSIGYDLASTTTNIARFFEKMAEVKQAEPIGKVPRPLSGTSEGSLRDVLQADPEDLIDLSTYGTKLRHRGLPMIRQIFERLFAARDSEQERLAERLQQVADAESIVQAAFDQFKDRGNAERLVLAAALLERYGRAALWPLRHMARSGAPECEYFVDTLANLAEDTSLFESMEELINIWSRHPARSVRLRLLEVNEALPYALRTALLERLTHDQDEEISEMAQEILQSDL